MAKSIDDLISFKMKKAISNIKSHIDPQVLNELCDLTYNDELADKIISQCQDNLCKSTAANYNQIYNFLVVVEHLLLNGREELVEKIGSLLLESIFKLKTYQCKVMLDICQLVRDKATKIINLLNNGEQLYNERLQLFQERNKTKFLNGAKQFDALKADKERINKARFEITEILSKIDLNEDEKENVLESLINNQDTSSLDTYVDDITPKQMKKLKEILSNTFLKSKACQSTGDIIDDTKSELSESNLHPDLSIKDKRLSTIEMKNMDDLRHNSMSSEESSSSSLYSDNSFLKKNEKYLIIDGSNVAFK